jgi:phosphoribosylaminoimidazole-succinocarboxamide synthase
MMHQHLLVDTGNFSIRTNQDIHTGKIRSTYWLDECANGRLADREGLNPELEYGIMITSDRTSAFDATWSAEGNIGGVYGKGAAINAQSEHFFALIKQKLGIENHIVAPIHPNVWIVQRARGPILLEAIVRGNLTGSFWSAYEDGERNAFGINLPDSMQKYGPFAEALFTPSTKGVMRGIEGIPEKEDARIDQPWLITENFDRFGLRKPEDLETIASFSKEIFKEILQLECKRINEHAADFKGEWGYFYNSQTGIYELRIMDEISLDSMRSWTQDSYQRVMTDSSQNPVEQSKELLRRHLLERFGNQVKDSKIALELSKISELDPNIFSQLSQLYISTTQKLTGRELQISERPREEINDSLNELGVLR